MIACGHQNHPPPTILQVYAAHSLFIYDEIKSMG